MSYVKHWFLVVSMYQAYCLCVSFGYITYIQVAASRPFSVRWALTASGQVFKLRRARRALTAHWCCVDCESFRLSLSLRNGAWPHKAQVTLQRTLVGDWCFLAWRAGMVRVIFICVGWSLHLVYLKILKQFYDIFIARIKIWRKFGDRVWSLCWQQMEMLYFLDMSGCVDRHMFGWILPMNSLRGWLKLRLQQKTFTRTTQMQR